jgi:hypothetical protein
MTTELEKYFAEVHISLWIFWARSSHVSQMAEDADLYYVMHQLLKLPVVSKLM